MAAEEVSSVSITSAGYGHLDWIDREKPPYKGQEFLEVSDLAVQHPRWWAEISNPPYRYQYATGNMTAYIYDDNIHHYKHSYWMQDENPHLFVGDELKGRHWGENKTFFPELVTVVVYGNSSYSALGRDETGFMQKHWAGFSVDIYGVEAEPDGAFYRKELGTEYNYILKEAISGLDIPPTRPSGWRWFKQYDVIGTKVPPEETLIVVLRNCSEVSLNRWFVWIFGIAIEV